MREIKLFGKALNTQSMSPVKVNRLAVSKGYVVHPDCCNERVYDFLQAMPTNYYNTFYQSVADVVEKGRFELLVDQLLHYASTYGTSYQGRPYIPNSSFGAEVMTDIDFSQCKVISPITIEEISEKVCQMLYSGIALKEDTLQDIFSLIGEFQIPVDINQVKNIEAKMHLYVKLGVLPSCANEMVRFLVFLHTSQTLLIKNNEVLRTIIANPKPIAGYVTQFGPEKLASVFFRYKPLFLAMKCEANKVIINKLRRLADKHHKPFVAGFWETVLSGKSVNASQFILRLSELSNFKKVRLIKAISDRMSGMTHKLFIIRNGKTHIEPAKSVDTAVYTTMKGLLMNSLVESLKAKACSVRLPKDIRLAVPSSEKTFVGNIPFGSYIMPAKKNSIFGIVWRGEDGAQDLDLAYMEMNGQRIGWDSSYYSDEQSIVYSGDMTSANPEACEYMFCKQGLADGIITVNAFNAHNDSRFTFFVGQTEDDFTVSRNTPSEDIIKFKAQMKITGETCLGFYMDGKIYFADLNSGNSRVSSFTPKMRDTLKYFTDTKDCFIYWDEVLTAAGFTITDSEECDIDLSNGDISQMISLLS